MQTVDRVVYIFHKHFIFIAASSFQHVLCAACFSGPAPTTGVPVVVTSPHTVEPTVSATCDVFPLYYIIKYRLSSSTGDYTTVNISGASVTLVNLVPNAEYDVEVAAISSNETISNLLLMANFTVAPITALAAPPSEIYKYITIILCILDYIVATASPLAFYTCNSTYNNRSCSFISNRPLCAGR